jgi:hypothetical protein
MDEKDDGKDGVTIDQFFKGASQRAISFPQTVIEYVIYHLIVGGHTRDYRT